MKLSKRQEKALKSWVNGATIEWRARKAAKDVGPARTVNSLCKRGLIAEFGFSTFRLTTVGVAELRLRGFFTRPPGVKV